MTQTQTLPTTSNQAEETTPASAPKPVSRGKMALAIAVAACVLAAVVYVLFFSDSKTKVNVPAPNNAKAKGTDQKAGTSGSEMTGEALEIIKKKFEEVPSPKGEPGVNASTNPTGKPLTPEGAVPSAQPGSGSGTFPTEVGKGPVELNGQPPKGATEPTTAGRPAQTAERPLAKGTYRAISYADGVNPPAEKATQPVSAPRVEPVPQVPFSARAVVTTPPARPALGTLLPVTLMGGLTTVVQGGLVRFQLSRDVVGRNWRLPQGTVFVGRVSGADGNRGYVRIFGYVTETEEFVPLSASLAGNDGLPGLVGARRRLDSRWATVLGRIGNAALTLGQSVLLSRSRGGVFLPISSLPQQVLTSEVATLQPTVRKNEFVQVPAGATGYLLVDELPDVRLVQSLGQTPSSQSGDAGPLTDAELSALIENFDPERIRQALPRMTPEIRALFERALELDAESRRLEGRK